METMECPICGAKNTSKNTLDQYGMFDFYVCPVCGKYELNTFDMLEKLNKNRMAPYLFYNRFSQDTRPYDNRYHTVRSKEACDKFTNDFLKGDIPKGRPVYMDNEIINAWYPKTFAERVDCIVEYIGTHMEHIGQQITFSYPEMLSMLFVDRYGTIKNSFGSQTIKRSRKECQAEAKYMLDSIANSGIIEYGFGSEEEKAVFIRLTPKGYARVDELQKNTAYGKAVLVAMKFGDDTIPLREAIRNGISNAGYVAVFIDEVQHNDFITPELLKHIRDSKFVVVDLTHKNNGAYFEEGYAMGLGKPVIQLCKKNRKLHFDIAQKNTIMWQTEDDIPEKLCNRIKATID